MCPGWVGRKGCAPGTWLLGCSQCSVDFQWLENLYLFNLLARLTTAPPSWEFLIVNELFRAWTPQRGIWAELAPSEYLTKELNFQVTCYWCSSVSWMELLHSSWHLVPLCKCFPLNLRCIICWSVFCFVHKITSVHANITQYMIQNSALSPMSLFS